jgi:hypothetical protein
MTEEPLNDDSENSSAKSAIILVVIIILVAIYSTSYGLQTIQWISEHQWASANPFLKEVPQPIAVLSGAAASAASPDATAAPDAGSAAGKKADQSKGTEVGEYGYQMTVPWTSKMKESPSAGGAEFRFDTGQIIIFGDPDAQLDTVHTLRDTPGDQYMPFAPLFADGRIANNYDLYEAVYDASPSQVSPFTNYATAQRDRVLLLMKLSFGFDLAKPIYSFDFGANKGFQFGDPAKGPVAIRAFGSHDRQFRFIFTVFAGSGGQIAQGDINEAMQTLASAVPVSK